MFHCALYSPATVAESQLRSALTGDLVIFHNFHTLEQLAKQARRVTQDLIFLGGSGDLHPEISLTKAIKARSTLIVTPLVLYHPFPDRALQFRALESGADEFLFGPWDNQLFGARLRMVVNRSQRDISINPSSRLPGPSLIDKEIEHRVLAKDNFAVCYADLDNFKAYNDYYGYFYGDKVIRLTARVIRDSVYDLAENAFVGHVGGDDFVFLIPTHQIDSICTSIITTFDRVIPFRYPEADRQRGFILTRNRRAEYEQFPIMTISIAAVPNVSEMFTHAGQFSHMLADLKKYIKTLPGSNYRIERRKRY